MATETTPKSGLLAPVSTGTSQATVRNTAPSARNVRTYMTLSQVRFGGPTGVARAWRAVASWLCVAGLRRVCLCRAPSGRGRRPAELRSVDAYTNEMAAHIRKPFTIAGGQEGFA